VEILTTIDQLKGYPKSQTTSEHRNLYTSGRDNQSGRN